MKLIAVTFERIFSVEKKRSKAGDYTDFVFGNSQMNECEARVNGHPEIKDGMLVTLALSKETDWSSILGWINHKNGEIFCPGPGFSIFKASAVFFALLMFITTIVITACNKPEKLDSMLLGFSIPFTIGAVVFLFLVREIKQIKLAQTLLNEEAMKMRKGDLDVKA